MFVRNDVTVDVRVLKEAASLTEAGHLVTIVGSLPPESRTPRQETRVDGVHIVRIRLPRWRRWWRWLRLPSRAWARIRRRISPGATQPHAMDDLDWLAMWRFGTIAWARSAARAAPLADVYQGHDLTGLPAAWFAARRTGAPLVYDSHELFLGSTAVIGRPARAIAWLAGLERRWARAAVALVTVNDSIADRLGPELGLARRVVVHNCPPRWDPPAQRPTLLRDRLGIPEADPIVLYHGGFRLARGLPQIADAMLEPGLERAHVVFLGFGPLRDELEARAAQVRHGGRLHVLPAVSPNELPSWVASADVGVMPNQPLSENERLSSPNKLFESIAVGLPVVSADYPERRRVVLDDPEGPLGAMCDPTDPASIASAIRSILELDNAERDDLRERCLRAARERWNWEHEVAGLLELYADLGARHT